MSSRFVVLYTKDKVKKAKTFHDGYVMVAPSGKASLFSEEGEVLDTGSFAPSCFVPDASIEFERFIVEISSDQADTAPPRLSLPPAPSRNGRVSFQENSVPIRPAPASFQAATPSADPLVQSRASSTRSLADVLSLLKSGGSAAPVAAAPVASSRGPAFDSPVVAMNAIPHSFPSRSVVPTRGTGTMYEPPAKRQNVKAAPVSELLVATPSALKIVNNNSAHFLCGPIRYPSRDQIRSAPRTLSVQIPLRFDSVREYVTVYSNAVRETVNLQLCRVADAMFSVLAKSSSVGTESLFKSARIEAYANCQISTREWRGLKGKVNVSLMLALPSGWMTRSRGEHSKDDLWAISFSGTFENDVVLVRTVFHGISQSGQVNLELMPHQFGAMVAKSGSDSCQVNPSFKGQSNVCAYRLLSASTELQELTTLALFGEGDPLVNNLVIPRTPLRLPVLTPFPPPSILLSVVDVAAIQNRIVDEFHLNDEQRGVLDRVTNWFTNRSNNDNVTLVHGVFGAGKSTLLVAIILFLVEVMDRADNLTDERKLIPQRKADIMIDDDDDDDVVIVDDSDVEEGDARDAEQQYVRTIRMRPPPFRIAISSSTNTAVDRVLEGLLDAGCRDVLRVGSIKKMSRRVLPFTLYEEEKDAIYELRKQLRADELSSGERVDLERELEELVSGRAGKRKERLGLCPIVGTTCSASLFKLFKDHQFAILMLDECSQMVEPLSLLPIKSFEPRKLICVGDPMQLAPPLPTDNGARDLSLALFSRLATHYTPILLATQYRCHPRIADLASHLFYEGRLKSGVSEDERRPIVAGFDPLMVVDTAGIGVESKDSNGSWSNAMHTRITVQLLLSKIAPNFPSPEAMAQRVGVISMFRAQTRELRKAMALHQILSSVRVSTVDSFQGAECDVIIVVSSRVGDNAGGSFLSDTRRLNVTLTRCKYHCIIIGDAKALKGASKEWATIVNQSRVVYADNLLMD